MKYIIFSFDDGTIYDIDLINLMNKYQIKGTFNLNSGLDDYSWWYNDESEIKRLTLKDYVSLYNGHEVNCHSHTHPRLDECEDDKLYEEIFLNKKIIEETFKKEIKGFATPFDTYNEHVLDVIKEANFKYCRLPEVSNDLSHKDEDNYHIKVNALTFEHNLFNSVDELISDSNKDSYLVIAGHSYEFHVNNSWEYIENVFKYIKEKKISTITMEEFINKINLTVE